MDDVLITDRLILRKLKQDDAELIFKNWTSDTEVTKYVTWETHKNIKETTEILNIWLKEYESPKTVRFGIVLKENNELIGMIDIVDFDDGVPEIGYVLSRKYWNHGYMSEACKAFTDYLFAIGYDSLIIAADERNIASNKVIQKTGFKFTHQERRLCSFIKPVMVTINWYAMSK